MAKVRGVTVPITADTKKFNAEINKLTKDAKQLQKSLELEFDNKRFAEAQRLAQQAIVKTEKHSKALRDELNKLESEGKIDTSEYQKLQSELVKSESKAILLKKNLDEINQIKLNNLVGGFKNVGDSISKAGQSLIPFSAAAGAALASIGAMGLNTVKYADDLKTMADRVNLSATALQRWQYIAMQTDVTNEELQAGLVKAQGAFASLAKGDLDVMSKALMELGFSQDQAAQGMEANFEQMVNALASVEDPMIQAAYANDIFGERMGAKLIPMLKAGGAGLQDLSEEFKKFNVLTEDQVVGLADFDNSLNNTKYALTTIKNEVGVALLPVMETLNQMLNEKIIPAVQKMAGWFNDLSDSQKNTIVGVLAVTAALAPTLLVIGKLISGIGSMIGMVSKLRGALSLLSGHPVIAIIGVVIGLMSMLYATNEDFRNSINDLVGTLMSSLAPILTMLGSIFESLMESLMPLVQMVGNYLAQAIRVLLSMLDPFIKILASIQVVFMSILPPIIKLISMGFTPLLSLLGVLTKALKWVADGIAKVFSGLPEIINNVLGWVESKVNKFIDFLNTIIGEVNKLSKHLGFTLQELDHVKLQIETKGSYTPTQAADTASVQPSLPQQAIQQAGSVTNSTVNNVVNNDYSDKDITVNVTVQNYAQDVDVKDLVNRMNIELAKQF